MNNIISIDYLIGLSTSDLSLLSQKSEDELARINKCDELMGAIVINSDQGKIVLPTYYLFPLIRNFCLEADAVRLLGTNQSFDTSLNGDIVELIGENGLVVFKNKKITLKVANSTYCFNFLQFFNEILKCVNRFISEMKHVKRGDEGFLWFLDQTEKERLVRFKRSLEIVLDTEREFGCFSVNKSGQPRSRFSSMDTHATVYKLFRKEYEGDKALPELAKAIEAFQRKWAPTGATEDWVWTGEDPIDMCIKIQEYPNSGFYGLFVNFATYAIEAVDLLGDLSSLDSLFYSIDELLDANCPLRNNVEYCFLVTTAAQNGDTNPHQGVEAFLHKSLSSDNLSYLKSPLIFLSDYSMYWDSCLPILKKRRETATGEEAESIDRFLQWVDHCESNLLEVLDDCSVVWDLIQKVKNPFYPAERHQALKRLCEKKKKESWAPPTELIEICKQIRTNDNEILALIKEIQQTEQAAVKYTKQQCLDMAAELTKNKSKTLVWMTDWAKKEQSEEDDDFGDPFEQLVVDDVLSFLMGLKINSFHGWVHICIADDPVSLFFE